MLDSMLNTVITPMAERHLPDVLRIQEHCFEPELWESAEVMENRILRFGEDSFVAEIANEVVGYAMSFPWKMGHVPPLNAPFPSKLPAPDSFFLQDISLMPTHRGQGIAQQLFDQVLAHGAALGFDDISLVAIAQSGEYWDRLGFTPLSDVSPTLQAYLEAQYGRGARLMRQTLKG